MPTAEHRETGIDWGDPVTHRFLLRVCFLVVHPPIKEKEKMSNRILIVGALACLSVAAVAQSDQNKDKAPAQVQDTTSTDSASGQANAKRMHKPMTITAEVSKEAATPSKTSAHDDWNAQSGKSAAPKATAPAVRVAPADVSGDGNAREIQTGQQSGKKQTPAATSSKENEVTPKQK